MGNPRLEGYIDTEDPIPSYRAVSVPLQIDAVTVRARITGQSIGSLALPDFAREHITERLELALALAS